MKGMLLLTVLLAIALAAAGCTGTGTGTPTSTPTPGVPGVADASVNETLRAFVAGAQQSLDRVDANVSAAATALGTTGLTGTGAEGVLLNLSRSGIGSGNYSTDAVTFDANGEILAAMPADYQFAVGANIHGSPNVQSALNGTAGLSQRINLVEGFRGVALSYPVRNASGVSGGASLTLRPERLLAVPALAALGNTSHVLSAIQTDGTVIFDANIALIGQSILNATQYGGATDLARIAQEIVSTPSGFERYQGNGTTRAIAWQTVGLHGTEWRLVVNQGR
jgi:hypothetical protein